MTKQEQHAEKLRELKKHFSRLKLRAFIIWLLANLVINTVTFLFFTVEIIVAALIIGIIITTMIFINYLNRLDKIRVAQEMRITEEAPVNRLKL